MLQRVQSHADNNRVHHYWCIYSVTAAAATSGLHGQRTVRPPGHQCTGTNHQSEWLLMELEQLPQTIKKRQEDLNSDVLKGGVGGLRSVH